LSLARGLEVIINNQKKSSIISTIPEEDEIREEELEALNAILFLIVQRLLNL
jgi:hypothetical protein